MERQKEIILDGTVTIINYDHGYPYYAVRNDSESDVYISSSDKTVTKGADGVIRIPVGGSYVHSSFGSSVLFIKGSGAVTVIAQSTVINPFKGALGSGGGNEVAWDEASGNPVTMNGLQEGVPFGSIILASDEEKVLTENDKVDETTSKGVVTASGYNGYSNYPWKAFDGIQDGSTQSRWVGYYESETDRWERNWIMYKYSIPVIISYIEFGSTPEMAGQNWKLSVYGSNDGSSFDLLGSFEFEGSASGTHLDFNTETAYKYFKFQTYAAGEIRIFAWETILGSAVDLTVNGSTYSYEFPSNPFEIPYGSILQQENNVLSVSDPSINISAVGMKKSSLSIAHKHMYDLITGNYALKSKYGDTTINVGRKADTDVGLRSTAEGRDTTASGHYSHAEGDHTTASGGQSHAEGNITTASGNISHAEGHQSRATGDASHAEGWLGKACGHSSHAEGDHTTASGDSAHAEGTGTTASGHYSHAGGYYTNALHMYEVTYGKYNQSNDDTLFSIGDGTANDARHNAFEITTTGGKLHDKDIATTDLIPTSLPANGGNADTLDNKHANDFANSYNYETMKFLNGQTGDIRALVHQLPSGGYIFDTSFAGLIGITFPFSGNGILSWIAGKYSANEFIYGILIIRPMLSTGNTYICSVYNTHEYTEWERIYTDHDKP